MSLDSVNGFGVIGRFAQEYINDECPKRPVSCLNLIDPRQ